jgi:hypothetical protein
MPRWEAPQPEQDDEQKKRRRHEDIDTETAINECRRLAYLASYEGEPDEAGRYNRRFTQRVIPDEPLTEPLDWRALVEDTPSEE